MNKDYYNSMKYIETILICFVFLFAFSCKNVKQEKQENVCSLMDITSYTGNAIAFFKDGLQSTSLRYFVQLIPISEQDSNVFKMEDFDIYKAAEGKPSFFFNIDYTIYKLYVSEYKKQKIDEICNVTDFLDSYVKVWIDYQDYDDISKERGDTILTDSCAVRELFIGMNGKLNEFKILKTIPAPEDL